MKSITNLLILHLSVHFLFGLFPYPLLAAPVGQERQNTSSKSKDWWNRLKAEEQNLSAKRDERRNLVNQIENASENQQKNLQEKIRQLNRELDLISAKYRQLISEGDTEKHEIPGGDTQRPTVLFFTYPHYSEEARAKKIEGMVQLQVVFDRSGSVTEVQVVQGLGYGLDEEAGKTVRQIVFFPKVENGHFAPYRTKIVYSFSFTQPATGL